MDQQMKNFLNLTSLASGLHLKPEFRANFSSPNSLLSNPLDFSAAALNSGAMALVGGAIESVEAKLIDYRGQKVASFEVDDDTMICLPQAYDMFLKHLVGGHHTVYT